ncbi:hypothetical protein CR152_32225 (plasmid) [Massilia violaceinigra]|uniref:Uncharacterized protein n=1 Tax=Massilia violaceinigra TaxID=2045208 RepID=A0A2D2DW98_9BURK|nr:hypothetical protein [Massilia violaceinigra]ATQ79244.1 hypothetical protein CR152_32225 [Massilia violaceinigra]
MSSDSELFLVIGFLALSAGLCLAVFQEWGWKIGVWMGAFSTPSLVPAIRDCALMPSVRSGAQFGGYEEVTRAWWGHGFFMFGAFVVVLGIAWLITKGKY